MNFLDKEVASETLNQVRLLRMQLKSAKEENEKQIFEIIKNSAFVYERDLKTKKRNQRKVVRTKVKVYQLKSLRNKMSENELNEDYKEFRNEMERNIAKILENLFPEDGIEASFISQSRLT